MAQPKWNDTVGPSKHFRTAWTGGTPSDYNVLENGPGGSVGCQYGYCSRQIIVSNPTGPIVVIDGDGANVTLPLAGLITQPTRVIQIQKIVAEGSSAATIELQW